MAADTEGYLCLPADDAPPSLPACFTCCKAVEIAADDGSLGVVCFFVCVLGFFAINLSLAFFVYPASADEDINCAWGMMVYPAIEIFVVLLCVIFVSCISELCKKLDAAKTTELELRRRSSTVP